VRDLRMCVMSLAMMMAVLAPAADAAWAGNGQIGKRAYWSAKKALCALGFRSYC
jgi:hypothetical protein